jgi:hypothetical protein
MPYELKHQDTSDHWWCTWASIIPLEVVHFGKLESGQRVTSGQANFANYSTEAELETKVDSLKYAGYYLEQRDIDKDDR